MSAEAPVFQPRPQGDVEDPSGSFPMGEVVVKMEDGVPGQVHGHRGAAELSAEARAQLNAAVSASRITRPLPNSRRAAPAANFVPQAATVAKSGEEKENRRRLIVVLSQVGHIQVCSQSMLQRAPLTTGMPRGISRVVWLWRKELVWKGGKVCATQL